MKYVGLGLLALLLLFAAVLLLRTVLLKKKIRPAPSAVRWTGKRRNVLRHGHAAAAQAHVLLRTPPRGLACAR